MEIFKGQWRFLDLAGTPCWSPGTLDLCGYAHVYSAAVANRTFPSQDRIDRRRELGERLVVARRRRDLSQAQVAENLGLSELTIKNWEAGRSEPGGLDLPKLVRLLDVDYDALLEGPLPSLRPAGATDTGRIGSKPVRGRAKRG